MVILGSFTCPLPYSPRIHPICAILISIFACSILPDSSIKYKVGRFKGGPIQISKVRCLRNFLVFTATPTTQPSSPPALQTPPLV